MINRFALSFLYIELDRTRNVRGHACLYTTTVLVNFAKTMLCFSKPWGPIIGRGPPLLVVQCGIQHKRVKLQLNKSTQNTSAKYKHMNIKR